MVIPTGLVPAPEGEGRQHRDRQSGDRRHRCDAAASLLFDDDLPDAVIDLGEGAEEHEDERQGEQADGQLQRGEGAEDTVLRANIEAITASGKSLMPEGLEARITPQEMTDLIAFILEVQR